MKGKVKILILAVMVAISGNSLSQPVPWVAQPTGSNQSIFIDATVNPTFNGNLLQAGDVIALFYDSLGRQACGGVVTWTGSTISLTAYGQYFTGKGFASGERLKFKIWKKMLNCIVDSVAVSFAAIDGMLVTASDQYVENGISYLISLSGQQNAVSYNKHFSCQNDANQTPVIAGKIPQLKFTSQPGLVIDQNTGVINLKSSLPGNYTVNFQTTACLSVSGFNITVNSVPAVNLGSDVKICQGNKVKLDAQNTGSFVLWSTGESMQTITVSSTNQYWVKVTTAQGCSNSDTLKLTVLANPVVDLGRDTTICQGASITLNTQNLSNAVTWSTGSTNNSITVNSAGVYSVQVIDPSNCKAFDNIRIVVNQLDASKLETSVTNSGCNKDGEIIIQEQSIRGGKIPFLFSVTNEISNQSISGYNHTFEVKDGSYRISVKDADGCSSASAKKITISRNEDCKNPILAPDAMGQLASFFIPYSGTAKIYDKNGQLKKYLRLPANWDGRDDNETIVPMGDYFIICDNGKNITVTVIK